MNRKINQINLEKRLKQENNNIIKKEREIKGHSNKKIKLGLVSADEFDKKYNFLQMRRNLTEFEEKANKTREMIMIMKKSNELQKDSVVKRNTKRREFTPSKSNLAPKLNKKISKPKKTSKKFIKSSPSIIIKNKDKDT